MRKARCNLPVKKRSITAAMTAMLTPATTVSQPFILSLLILSLSFLLLHSSSHPPASVCIIGSGIGGSSVAHFLRKYSSNPGSFPAPLIGPIHIFERHERVGGRMATVTVSGETFEAGASILHPKNFHTANFTQLLNLKCKTKENEDSSTLGIWDGNQFVFKTIRADTWKYPILKKIIQQINSLRLLWRYGISLLRMESFIENTVDKFLRYYESTDTRPVFESVEQMLRWSGLYNLTGRTLKEELLEAGLELLLIEELITVITRINYGQSCGISGLAGAVSMAGSVDGLWAVEGGNWQMAKGLVDNSDVTLHLKEEIASVSRLGKYYNLNSVEGHSNACEVVVVATPLDELGIKFDPPVSVPDRKMQHTFTTFVRGLLNPAYFGLSAVAEIPGLIGTLEDPNIPFSSISVLKKHGEEDMTYKVFSRKPMDDELLNLIFSVRVETIKIDWAAYPQYKAPESFAPFILDDSNLYYVNAFENAASTMETSAVAAENIARLILSRLSSNQESLRLEEEEEAALKPEGQSGHMEL